MTAHEIDAYVAFAERMRKAGNVDEATALVEWIYGKLRNRS